MGDRASKDVEEQKDKEGKAMVSMEDKEKIYEQMQRDKKSYEKGKQYLVDFEKKRWNNMDSN